jgi:DNA polymerase-3 subunit epsilon
LDRYLAEYEEDALVETALDLGVSRDLVDQIHRDYLRSMARVALADGVVTSDERADLDRVAELLGFSGADVDAALALAPSRSIETEFALRAGDCVCLTGDMSRPRSDWESIVSSKGLLAGGLSKRTRVLVAADPDSASGKATKARAYGIPIITEEAFERLLEKVRLGE